MKKAIRVRILGEAWVLRVVAKVERKTRTRDAESAAASKGCAAEPSSGALSGKSVGIDVGDRVSQFWR